MDLLLSRSIIRLTAWLEWLRAITSLRPSSFLFRSGSTDPRPTDTRFWRWARIPSYSGNFSKKTFKFPTSQTIDRSQKVIELKRELHWKWSRNGLLNGICKMQPWDDYSFFPLTSIESALRSKSYPIKLIWKCSKSIQWPNFFGNISPTKYGWSPQDQESSSELKTKFLIKQHSKQFSPTKILHLQSQLSLKTFLKIWKFG